MTEPPINPPLFRDELVSTASEREMLETFLDLYRDVIVNKATGVSDEDARRRLVPSMTTIGGIVKHLRWVEFGWFHQLFGEHSGDNQRRHDRDWEFRFEPDERLDQFIADYRQTCARSRRIAATHALDDTVPHHRMGQVSLRWIYVHLIEETARHAGHIDILREQIDGSTGFD
ncbi:MAG: DinB family protein [Sciscionella sp.]|nr:DinB family protein [Sciscionella sp.]